MTSLVGIPSVEAVFEQRFMLCLLAVFCQVRKCELYYDEMKECQSYSSQLHQYYVYGEKQSCQNWVDNYADCRKWSTDQDMEALVSS